MIEFSKINERYQVTGSEVVWTPKRKTQRKHKEAIYNKTAGNLGWRIKF